MLLQYTLTEEDLARLVANGIVIVSQKGAEPPPPGEGMISAEDWDRFKRAVQQIKDKPAADPDGQLVPLPDKPEQVRTAPGLPLATYLVMVRG
jgi:hypothetical protein